MAPISPDDLHVAAAASGELGAGYEQAVADSLLERVEQRLQQRAGSALQDTVTLVTALGSIGLGVVFALVAAKLGPVGGTLATVVAWVAIVAVNVAHARAR